MVKNLGVELAVSRADRVFSLLQLRSAGATQLLMKPALNMDGRMEVGCESRFHYREAVGERKGEESGLTDWLRVGSHQPSSKVRNAIHGKFLASQCLCHTF